MPTIHPLREIRQRLNVTAKDAAARLNWSTSALLRVELRDLQAGDGLVARMAESLGLTLAEARAICGGVIDEAHGKILRDAFRFRVPDGGARAATDGHRPSGGLQGGHVDGTD